MAELGFGSKHLAAESVSFTAVHPVCDVKQSSVVRRDMKGSDGPSFLLSLKMMGNKAKGFSLVMMFPLAELRDEINITEVVILHHCSIRCIPLHLISLYCSIMSA